MFGPHWVCPSSRQHLLSGSTLLRLQVALQVYCLKRALSFVHFPDLSSLGSGSWVLHKGTDSGVHFVIFPGPSRSGDQVLCKHTVPGALCLNQIPSPGCSVSRVPHKSTISGMLCVSSGELISGFDPPGRCQPSRIPGRLVSNWEPAHSLVEDPSLWAEISSYLLALAVACLPPCLQWQGRGLYAAR